MGRVWAARHTESGAEVAIKVLTDAGARRPAFLRAFTREVISVARLTHPGIVSVYDHGRVPSAPAEGRAPPVPPGSPYLVMERVTGGALSEWLGHVAWEEARRVLEAILEALAHAHARGVVHRDLKPANVLLTRAGQPKLTDFGIAQPLDLEDGEVLAAGTPGFMAPEQADREGRALGPWTDLFAVGRLACVLLGGPMSVPRWAPRTPVPSGLAAWIARMTHPDPVQRFQRAADALAALRALGEPTCGVGEGREDPSVAGEPAPDGDGAGRGAFGQGAADRNGVVRGATPAAAGAGSDGDLERLESAPTLAEVPESAWPAAARDGHASIHAAPPPLPEDWRRIEAEPTAEALRGAGLGLWGLKALPLVGREALRDALWSALGAVHRHRRARVVLLQGAAGAGKTRLAEWLAETAHAAGAVEVLRARHGALRSAGDGLEGMLARWLGLRRLDRASVVTRLDEVLLPWGLRDPAERLAIAEVIAPSLSDDGAAAPAARRVRFSGAAERHAAILRLLERLASVRPLLLHLDDVQWGSDTLEFVQALLDAQARRPLAALVVCTVREEALEAREAEQALLTRLAERPEVETHHVGPLPPQEHQALVRGLLGLEETLAAQIEARSAGNPLFAVQVVDELVRSGRLEHGPDGYAAPPGVTLEVPDDLHQIWMHRIESFLEGRPEDDATALELGAALGVEVDAAEWQACLERAGASVSSDLVPALIAQRLGRPAAGDGFGFVHGLLRESLERRAKEAGRWAEHHRICAEVLEAKAGPKDLARIGEHFLAAGRYDEAVACLSAAAYELESMSEALKARLVLARREEALRRLAPPATDRRWTQGWLLRARVGRAAGRLDEAEAWAKKALEHARQLKRPEEEAKALYLLSVIARYRGATAVAWRRIRESDRVAERHGLEAQLGYNAKEKGWIRLNRGDREEAIALLRKAVTALEAAGDRPELALSAYALGVASIQAGRLDEARDHLLWGMRLYAELGFRTPQGLAISSLGDVARMQGRLTAAERLYRTAERYLGAAGYGHTIYIDLNRGLLEMQRGRFDRALEQLDRSYETLLQQGADGPAGAVCAMRLPCRAAAADWAGFDRDLKAATERLTRSGMADVDIAWPLGLAGDLAAERGEQGRARQAWALAFQQWQALGRREAREVEAKLAGAG